MFNNKKFHFIGIGGISMSGIALILKEEGYSVTGSDMQESNTVIDLRNKGIDVFIGENPELICDADIIVYTAAIQSDNKELIRAKELNKELYERAVFLGLLTKEYKNVICISGTHGKSTTTGMISSAFIESEKKPTIQIGAYLPLIKSNYLVGNKDYFIMESCEYVESFLHFFPTSAVILNIDDDHLDYFGSLENVKKSFSKFANLLPNNGNLVLNKDDKNTMDITIPENINVLTYGINTEADLVSKNISFDNYGHPEFDVYYKDKLYNHIHLNVPGTHNIYNALAAISISIIYDLDKVKVKDGLEKYHGVERRFELVGKYKDNILVYDDYAHHPTEIKSTLDSVKNVKCNKNWVVFQSHTYSRTHEHLNEFADVLKGFDNVIIAPIYPAREKNIWGVKEETLVSLIKKENENVIYIDSFDKIVKYLKDNLKDDDLVITVGAGPINKVGLSLLEKEK